MKSNLIRKEFYLSLVFMSMMAIPMSQAMEPTNGVKTAYCPKPETIEPSGKFHGKFRNYLGRTTGDMQVPFMSDDDTYNDKLKTKDLVLSQVKKSIIPDAIECIYRDQSNPKVTLTLVERSEYFVNHCSVIPTPEPGYIYCIFPNVKK